MKKASTLKPDVVLIDVHMQGMEGLETIREIRLGCHDTNILVLTEDGDQETALRAIEAGAVSHVLIQAGRRM